MYFKNFLACIRLVQSFTCQRSVTLVLTASGELCFYLHSTIRTSEIVPNMSHPKDTWLKKYASSKKY